MTGLWRLGQGAALAVALMPALPDWTGWLMPLTAVLVGWTTVRRVRGALSELS